MGRKRREVFMFDFDGTLVDTMGLHGKLAADVMHKHFGINREQAREKYYSTTGIPFQKQIKKIFPEASEKKLRTCAKEYTQRKNKEVFDQAGLFPETKKTLEKLSKKGHELIISSSTEEKVIRDILEKKGILGKFSEVYGCDSGSKEDHIKKVMKEKKPDMIVFTGDSRSDVKHNEYTVLTVGRAGEKDSGMLSPDELLESGADFATYNLKKLASPGRIKGTKLLRDIKNKRIFTIFKRNKK